jgi:hypothetical protein
MIIFWCKDDADRLYDGRNHNLNFRQNKQKSQALAKEKLVFRYCWCSNAIDSTTIKILVNWMNQLFMVLMDRIVVLKNIGWISLQTG